MFFSPSVAGTLSAQQQSRKCKDSTQETRVPTTGFFFGCRHGGPLLRKLPPQEKTLSRPIFCPFSPRPTSLASKSSSPSLRPENLLPGSALLLRGEGGRKGLAKRAAVCLFKYLWPCQLHCLAADGRSGRPFFSLDLLLYSPPDFSLSVGREENRGEGKKGHLEKSTFEFPPSFLSFSIHEMQESAPSPLSSSVAIERNRREQNSFSPSPTPFLGFRYHRPPIDGGTTVAASTYGWGSKKRAAKSCQTHRCPWQIERGEVSVRSINGL